MEQQIPKIRPILKPISFMPLVSAQELRSLYTKVASIKPRLAGLDVGTMKVGVALSDPELSVAIPSLTLNRNNCMLMLCYLM